nr:MAG TPA: hypothetical protein [Caudoviricetes sp.]
MIPGRYVSRGSIPLLPSIINFKVVRIWYKKL